MLSAKGITAFAIVGIMTIFLSSCIPVGATGYDTNASGRSNHNPFSGAVSFSVSLEPEFPTEKQPPVEYTDFDFSKYIDPMYDIMVTQLAIWTYDREKLRLKQVELLSAPPRLGGWLLNSLGMFILLTGLIGVVASYYIWLDRRKPGGV